jgi:hypothetical protein
MSDSRDMLINATMMQLRASATKCVATIEAILSNPTEAVKGTEYVDALTENVEKLAHYDNAIRVLSNTFGSQRPNKTPPSALTAEAQKQRTEAFMKAAEAVAKKNANDPKYKDEKPKKSDKKYDMYTDDPSDDPNV